MKTFKYSLLVVILLAGTFWLKGCQDLNVNNPNEPTREAVLGDVNNTLKLLRGGYQDVATAMVTEWGVHLHMLSDQTTTTNAFRSFWDFSEEPRLRLNNTTAYSAEAAVNTYWGNLNSGVAIANQFINLIENEGQTFESNGVDQTPRVLAQAYFLRGLARGYLGLIYDQAYLIEANFDTESADAADIEFAPYDQLIQGAVSDINAAISQSQQAEGFTFASMPNSSDSWTQEEFETIAHSFAARFLAGQARTAEERDQLDWQAILDHANAGLGGPDASASLLDFTASNVGSSGDFANYLADWLQFVVTCETEELNSCAGYNPIDVKQTHLLDPSYPTEYPEEHASASDATYPPAETDDPRIDYFVYTTNPGFLDPNRNSNLFSNYLSLRFYAENDWWPSNHGVHLFTSVENDMLRTEAHYMLDQPLEAANVLNNSTAGEGTVSLSIDLPAVQMELMEENGLSGGHSYDGTESLAEIQWALLREYSVELDLLGGIGLQWYFMRRHDLLQSGSPTMFPVPGEELELTGRSNYTYGGVDNAGQEGTASGDNSWTNLAEEVFDGSILKSKTSSESTPVVNRGIKVPSSNPNGKGAVNQ